MTRCETMRERRDDAVIAPARLFPAWHYRMLNAAARNRAIEAAVAAAPVAGKTVFEIGAGSGLVALLFARHGAAHVYTCELNPSLCDIARRIAAHSDYGDRITIFGMSSADVIRDGLLPKTPDIVFTETVDAGVVGEGFFGISADIKSLMGPDTLVMPHRIDQFGALVASQDFLDQNFVHDICGFNLSFLNAYSTTTYVPVWAALHDYRLLCAPALLRSYRYDAANPAEARPLAVTTAGRAHGILSWFALRYGAETVTNAPDTKSHWHQAFHPFETPVVVGEGETVQVALDDAGTARIADVGNGRC